MEESNELKESDNETRIINKINNINNEINNEKAKENQQNQEKDLESNPKIHKSEPIQAETTVTTEPIQAETTTTIALIDIDAEEVDAPGLSLKDLKNERNKRRTSVNNLTKTRNKYHKNMIKDVLKEVFASLPYNSELHSFCKKMSKEFLVHINKITERENSKAEFELGIEDVEEYYANSTRFGDNFKLTGSALAKEKPDWIARAEESGNDTNNYRKKCSNHCKFVAELEVKLAKENLRINIYSNMFVVAKALTHPENEHMKRNVTDKNFFCYNVN